MAAHLSELEAGPLWQGIVLNMLQSTDEPSYTGYPESESTHRRYESNVPPNHSRFTSGNCAAIEIQLFHNAKEPAFRNRNISEQEISAWIEMSGRFAVPDHDNPDLNAGGLRLLYGCGHKKNGIDDTQLPFEVETLDRILRGCRLPKNFSQFLEEETTRFCRETLYEESGKECGYNFVMKLFSWWLGTYTLALSYDSQTKIICGLLLGHKVKLLETLKERLEKHAQYAGHLMLVPILLCEMLAERQAKQVHTSTKRILTLETSIGVNDYVDLSERLPPAPLLTTTDFTPISQSLNGELSRLANYEKWANSHVVLLQNILKGPTFQGSATPEVRSVNEDRTMKVLREKVECLHGWNLDLLARIQCQQKIVNGQIQTVYNLLAQRDNKLNITIAAASQRDSTAMKTISMVSMVFIPGAYIATLFSMTMFNWQAKGDDTVVSGHFWIYWAFAIPITILVLLVWILWTRPWTAPALRLSS